MHSARWLAAALILTLSAVALASAKTPVPIADPPAKRIALSFDDTPRHAGAVMSEDERMIRLIAELDQAGVDQAVFFINPGRIPRREGSEARIAALVAAGHVIANHTQHHPQLRDTEAADYIAQIDAAEDWLRGRKGYRPWFRFPFLDEGGADKGKRDAIRAALAERGLRNGYVTVDASDWFYEQAFADSVKAGAEIDRDALRDLFVESHVEAAEAYDRVAKQALGRSPAHMMMLHETDLAALYLGDLVGALEADGWEIITADEAYQDPMGALQPDVPYAQGTLVEMIAWERGVPAPRWYERNDTRIAQREFDRRVLGKESSAE